MNEEDLRDCFAMFALCGYLSTIPSTKGSEADYAETAYKMADAMLEARKKKEVVSEVEDGIVAIKPKRRSKSE